MKLYLHIAETSDWSLLQLKGPKDLEQCEELWEQIVHKNAEENNNFNYKSFIQAQKSHALLMHDYILINTMVTKLYYKADKDDIKYLKRKGYNINIVDNKIDAESLKNTQQRTRNIITKIKMKRNEISQMYLDGSKSSKDIVSLEQILASLSANLGFSLDQTLTLARYNEYKKIINKKNARNKGR